MALAASPALEPGQNETEWLSYAPRSAWICVLGQKGEDGGFASFVNRVTSAGPKFDGADFSYKDTRFGWESDLRIDGKPIYISGYPRYESPYVNAQRGDLRFRISCAGLKSEIDLTELRGGAGFSVQGRDCLNPRPAESGRSRHERESALLGSL